jgi:hypothetical protein
MENEKNNNIFFKFPINENENEDLYKQAVSRANNYLSDESEDFRLNFQTVDCEKLGQTFKLYSDSIKQNLSELRKLDSQAKAEEIKIEENKICNFCGKKFSTAGNKVKHIEKVHEGQAFRCSVFSCPKTFKDRSNLEIHLKRSHNIGELFICQFCGKEFNHKCVVIAHEREKHLNHYPYHCLIKCNKFFNQACSENFSVKRKMVYHLKTKHGDVFEEFYKLLKEGNYLK